MHDYAFVRSVEALSMEIEAFFSRAYKEVNVDRCHYPLYSTLKLTVSRNSTISEVEIEISIDSPTTNQRYVDGIINTLWDVVADGASCLALSRLPCGERRYFDDNGICVDSAKSPQEEISDLWDTLPELDIATSANSRPSDDKPYTAPVSSSTISELKKLAQKLPHGKLHLPAGNRFSEWDLEEISPMRMLGYKVGNSGLSKRARDEFLSAFVEIDFPAILRREYLDEWGAPCSPERISKTINHISANISRAEVNDKKKYEVAIFDWRTDIEFLLSIKNNYR